MIPNSTSQRIPSRLSTLFTVYGTFQATTSHVANQPVEAGNDGPSSTIQLGKDKLNLIERVRPDYTTMAQLYFDDGHIGLAVLSGGQIAAMDWITSGENWETWSHAWPISEYAANPFALIDHVEDLEVAYSLQPRPTAINHGCLPVLPWD